MFSFVLGSCKIRNQCQNNNMKVIEIPPPEDLHVGTEEHPEGSRHVIRVEFYKMPDGSYYAWPYVRRLAGSGYIEEHFQMLKHFPDPDAARQAAINRGRTLISVGA